MYPVVDNMSMMPPVPKRTVRAATRVALRDGTVRGLVGHRHWRASGASAWLAGATVSLSLQSPLRVDADLPYIVIPPDAPARGECMHPYTRGWWHLKAPRVTRLDVWVDLRPSHRHVVYVDTDATQGTLSPASGKPHPWCQEVQSSS